MLDGDGCCFGCENVRLKDVEHRRAALHTLRDEVEIFLIWDHVERDAIRRELAVGVAGKTRNLWDQLIKRQAALFSGHHVAEVTTDGLIRTVEVKTVIETAIIRRKPYGTQNCRL